MNKAQIEILLSKLHLFSGAKPTLIKKLAENVKWLNAPRGTKLFNCYGNVQGLYLLLEGQVKLGVESTHGSERIISLIQPTQSFGDESLFLERPSPFYAHATLDSKIIFITKDAFFDILSIENSVILRLLTGFSERNHQLVNDIASISLENCMQRLIGYLLKVAMESPNEDRFKFPVSKKIIASMLSISPETLSRQMKILKKANLIEIKNKEICITKVTDLRKFSENYNIRV